MVDRAFYLTLPSTTKWYSRSKPSNNRDNILSVHLDGQPTQPISHTQPYFPYQWRILGSQGFSRKDRDTFPRIYLFPAAAWNVVPEIPTACSASGKYLNPEPYLPRRSLPAWEMLLQGKTFAPGWNLPKLLGGGPGRVTNTGRGERSGILLIVLEILRVKLKTGSIQSLLEER